VELEAEFLAALPERDWKPRFKACAVVGNSGTLLGKGFGAHIDTFDAVVRTTPHRLPRGLDRERERERERERQRERQRESDG
jgi:hypothetical protein